MCIGVLHVGMQGSRLKQQEFSLFSLKIQKLLTLQPICLRQQLLQSGSTSPLLTSSQLFSTLLGSSQLFTLALLTSSQLFNSSLLFSALLTSPVLMPSWGFSGSNIKDLIFLPTCNLAM
jgi:hypothetical protein